MLCLFRTLWVYCNSSSTAVSLSSVIIMSFSAPLACALLCSLSILVVDISFSLTLFPCMILNMLAMVLPDFFGRFFFVFLEFFDPVVVLVYCDVFDVIDALSF